MLAGAASTGDLIALVATRAACYVLPVRDAPPCDLDLPARGERCEVLVEYPRWSMVKRRSDGSVDFIAPLPCPYNYGSIAGRRSGDGDLLDAVVLGPRLPHGTRRSLVAVGVIGFLDLGVHDPKVICSEGPLSPRQRVGLELFFRSYATFKRALAAARRQPGATCYLGWLR
ncbi:MAG: inorganic diphosphatase [Nannocystis sp.]|nr:inorganic diphosphatase [Nannocystis sp.]